MAKVLKKEYTDDRQQTVDLHTKTENQFSLLHFRIRELEDQLHDLTEEDTPIRHDREMDFYGCVGRTKEQMEELEDIVKLWAYKTSSKSEVLAKIEAAPVKLRDKLLMMFIFACGLPHGPSGGMIGGPPELQMLFRRMFGG